jgi:hypothetical protein
VPALGAVADEVTQTPNVSSRVAISTGGCNTYCLSIERRMLSVKYRKRIYYTEADNALMWDR